MIRTILLSIVFLVLLGSISTLIYFSRWWTRICDVTQVYFVVFIPLLVIGVLVLLPDWDYRKTGAVALLLGAFVLHLERVLPYSTFFQEEVPTAVSSERSFSMLTTNVLQTNRDTGAFKSVIERLQPDVLLMIEYSPYWKAHTTFLKDKYAHHLEEAKEGYGVAMFSRFPFAEAELKRFEDRDILSVHATVELSTEDQVYIIGVHPPPPVPWGLDTKVKDQATLDYARLAVNSDLPTVVAGDFNDVSWSNLMRQFKQKSRLQDPRVGRGLFNTYHAKKFWIRYPIDHIFLSAELKIIDFQRVRVDGSDHFGLFARINY